MERIPGAILHIRCCHYLGRGLFENQNHYSENQGFCAVVFVLEELVEEAPVDLQAILGPSMGKSKTG